MSTDLTYTAVPSSYLHCMSSHCSQASTCLRAIAWSLLPQTQVRVGILNPAVITETAGCPYYRDATPARYALGFKGMQAKMVPAQYDRFMMFLQGKFGRNPYFERRKGERAMPPKEQDIVRQALAYAGMPADLEFDHYKMDYLW